MSKRQDTLLARLVQLASRLQDPLLPQPVVALAGFGSFFRGKDKPNDIDLILVTEKGTWPQTYPVIEAFRNLICHCGYEGYDTLHESALDYYELVGDEAPTEFLEHKDKLLKWCEYFPLGLAYDAGWRIDKEIRCDYIFKRMLQHNLPGLKIMEVTNDLGDTMMRAEVIHTIWTPDKPDVSAFVKSLWASDCIGMIAEEYVGFMVQIGDLERDIANTKDRITRMLNPRIGVTTAKKIKSDDTELFLMSFKSRPDKSKFEGELPSDLPQACEEARKRLKALQIEQAFLSRVLGESFRATEHPIWKGYLTKKQYVAWMAMCNRSLSTFSNDEDYRRRLEEIGLDTDHIKLGTMRCRRSKRYYQVGSWTEPVDLWIEAKKD